MGCGWMGVEVVKRMLTAKKILSNHQLLESCDNVSVDRLRWKTFVNWPRLIDSSYNILKYEYWLHVI